MPVWQENSSRHSIIPTNGEALYRGNFIIVRKGKKSGGKFLFGKSDEDVFQEKLRTT